MPSVGRLKEVVAAWEAEHGPITDEELAEQARLDKVAAAAVRDALRKDRVEGDLR